MPYPAWNTSQFYVSRTNIDSAERQRPPATQIVLRGVLGVNGDFDVGERKLQLGSSVSYGTSDNTQVTPAYVFQNVANALNATHRRQRQIVCAGTPVNASDHDGIEHVRAAEYFRQRLAELGRASNTSRTWRRRFVQHAARLQLRSSPAIS